MTRTAIHLIAASVLLCISGAGAAEVETAEPAKEEPTEQIKLNEVLSVRLLEPKALLVQERPRLKIEVANVSDERVRFVPPLDGSLYHWRYPRITIAVCDSDGESVALKLGGRCGNMNSLSPKNITFLDPGDKKTYSIGWPFRLQGFQKPGIYRFVLTYDLAAPDMDAWRIQGRFSGETDEAKVAKLLEQVPPLTLKTEPCQIEVKKVERRMVEEAIVDHFERREKPLFEFVGRGLAAGKWEVTDVRHFRGYISCVVQFAKGYTPPARPKYCNPEYWFQEGRYFFEPWDWTQRKGIKRPPRQQMVSFRFKIRMPKHALLGSLLSYNKDLATKLGFVIEPDEDAETKKPEEGNQ